VSTFNPDTAPTTAEYEAEKRKAVDHYDAESVERHNADSLATYARREAAQIVGNSQVVQAHVDAEDEQRRAATTDSAVVPAELVGEIGQEISSVVRLDDVARQAKALAHRVHEEAVELERLRQIEARNARRDELLADAWEASSKKRPVPEILAPMTAWIDGLASDHSLHEGLKIPERIQEQHAERNKTAVVGKLDELNSIVERHSTDALALAGSAAEILTNEGLTPDVGLDEILDSGSENAIQALRDWRRTVTVWGEIQSARAWLAVSGEFGFNPIQPEQLTRDERRRTGAYAKTGQTFPRAELELRTWRTQFDDLELPEWIKTAHSALVWRVAQD